MSDDYRHSAFWQDRYERGTAGWDKGKAAPPLVRALATLDLKPDTKVLVPGCGYGHEALHLAKRGCAVVAVDFAPAAIKNLTERAAGLSLQAQERDIFALQEDFARSFALVMEHTCFCAIPLDRRSDYARTMAEVLDRAGVLLGLFWEMGEDGGPPFNTSCEDLHLHFDPFFDLVEIERPGDSCSGRQDEEWLVQMVKK